MRIGSVALRPAFRGIVERERRDTGHQEAEYQPGERIWHVELSRIAAVGKDHVRAENGDRQAVPVVCLPQQPLAGPLAVRVSVGVAGIDWADRADRADITVFGEV